MKNFRCYQLAKEQYQLVKTLKLSRYENDQLQRAALSVYLNLAEGSAKQSLKDRRRFYEIAFASQRETQALIELTDNQQLAKTSDRLAGGLFNLLRALTPETTSPHQVPATQV